MDTKLVTGILYTPNGMLAVNTPVGFDMVTDFVVGDGHTYPKTTGVVTDPTTAEISVSLVVPPVGTVLYRYRRPEGAPLYFHLGVDSPSDLEELIQTSVKLSDPEGTLGWIIDNLDLAPLDLSGPTGPTGENVLEIKTTDGGSNFNLTEWQNSSGVPMTVVNSNGYVGIGVATPQYPLVSTSVNIHNVLTVGKSTISALTGIFVTPPNAAGVDGIEVYMTRGGDASGTALLVRANDSSYGDIGGGGLFKITRALNTVFNVANTGTTTISPDRANADALKINNPTSASGKAINVLTEDEENLFAVSHVKGTPESNYSVQFGSSSYSGNKTTFRITGGQSRGAYLVFNSGHASTEFTIHQNNATGVDLKYSRYRPLTISGNINGTVAKFGDETVAVIITPRLPTRHGLSINLPIGVTTADALRVAVDGSIKSVINNAGHLGIGDLNPVHPITISRQGAGVQTFIHLRNPQASPGAGVSIIGNVDGADAAKIEMIRTSSGADYRSTMALSVRDASAAWYTPIVVAADLVDVDDGVDINLGTVTGTKFGTSTTEKLGFWGSTPSVQPSAVGTIVGFVDGVGSTVKDDSTFTGGLGTTAYTVGDLVRILKTIGLLES